MNSNISGYLKWLLGPFWRWWWAVITGLLSIAAFFGTPESGLTLSKYSISILILIFLIIIFLLMSVSYQGWLLFSDLNQELKILSIIRTKDYESDWIFILSGYIKESKEALIEVLRPLEDTEVPFAMLKVIGKTAKGYIQAVPIWISPGHLRDFSRHKFSPSILIATPIIRYERIREVLSEYEEYE